MTVRVCPVYREYCRVHEFQHGAEAEELREGIEKLIERAREDDAISGDGYVEVTDLQRLLDRVDARDSVAFVEALPREDRKLHRERAAERKARR